MVQELALSQLLPPGKEGAGEARIASASVVEAWVLLLLSDGRALVLRGSPGPEPSLTLSGSGGEGAGDQLQGLSAASVFQDSHGWLEAELARRRDEEGEEDEEDGGDDGPAAAAGEGAGGGRDGGDSAAFAVLCSQRGGLRLCSLPDLTPVFSCEAFSTAREELCTPDEDEAMPGPADEEAAEVGSEEGDRVSSVRMESFPAHCLGVPLLFAVLGDGRSVAYRLLGGGPGLRLLKYDLDTSGLRAMDDPPKSKKKKGAGGEEGAEPSEEGGAKVPAAVHRFDGGRGVSGLFVTSQRPFWIVTRHGFLWVHPMTSNGPVPAFSAFHNVNCRDGFLYLTSEGKLDVCVLPEAVNVAGPWPSRRVALGGTPRAVTYLPESKLFALLVSARAPFRPAKPTPRTRMRPRRRWPLRRVAARPTRSSWWIRARAGRSSGGTSLSPQSRDCASGRWPCGRRRTAPCTPSWRWARRPPGGRTTPAKGARCCWRSPRGGRRGSGQDAWSGRRSSGAPRGAATCSA